MRDISSYSHLLMWSTSFWAPIESVYLKTQELTTEPHDIFSQNSQSNEKRIVQEIDFLSPERSSREGWESKSKDGANISFQWGCQDPFLVAVDGLVHEPEGNKPIYKPITCNVLQWAQALLCSGKPKCMLMVSKQLHPRSPDICFISKEDSS